MENENQEIEDVASRLSGQGNDLGSASPLSPEEQEPIPAAPLPAFDLARLSPDQLMALRDAMAALPQQRSRKRGNPIIKLRRIDGRMVIDFKNAYVTMQKNEETNVTSEVVMMGVRFMGDDGKGETMPDPQDPNKLVPKFTKIDWKNFMNADQVKCEVISTRRIPGSIVEGEVESNERPGVMVEMEVRTIQDFFTVKLPEGSPVPTVEVEGKIANA